MNDKVIITGAAGLVGQNLIALLEENRFTNIIAIDKNPNNVNLLRRLHPRVQIVLADLAEAGSWQHCFQDAQLVILLHAQITGKTPDIFIRNNIKATTNVLNTSKEHAIPFIIHVSSSAINSAADNPYANTKKAQETLVRTCGIKHCILRPTLMFGWFDPKHLGWLARFMEKAPFFPIPGHGRYTRQPLYGRDFCRTIVACIEQQPDGQVFDLVGPAEIDYIDIIKSIRKVKGLRTPLVPIPYWLFHVLLRVYALFSNNPPFTADQLEALTAGDHFTGVDMEATFGFKPTSFEDAIRETFCHTKYSNIVLPRDT